jgi:hypothetical protein
MNYIAKYKTDNFETKDYLNKAGVLTSYIKKREGIEIPTLYERKKYFSSTGKYWYEQYFDIIEIEDKPIKKCPYCDWTTTDIHNKSGAFEQHLKFIHSISKIEYIKKYPQEKEYFSLVNKTLEKQFETDDTKYVTCAICGKRLSRIDWKHLTKHGLTLHEYKLKYDAKTCSDAYIEFCTKQAETMNNAMDGNTSKYVSSYENEIVEYLRHYNIKNISQTNRSILNGKEIDIYLPDHKIGIEFNGNKWHTEWFGGKTKFVHLHKTEDAMKCGIKLIQIFEDEYVFHKRIVLDKILNTLKCNTHRIYARKCSIKILDKKETDKFLNENHIQGCGQYSISIGLEIDNILLCIMTFKKGNKNGEYELNRFSGLLLHNIIGGAGKILKYFIKQYKPQVIRTFADRRWTLSMNDNLYTKIGFKLVKVLKPDYRYYNEKIDRYMRFHKFGFRKNKLCKKYNFPITWTETEMIKKLGYDRIWDCGLIKYEWNYE